MNTRTLLAVVSVTAALASPVLAGSENAKIPSVSHHAVCGPQGQGTLRCHAHVTDDASGKPAVSAVPSGYGPVQFRGAYGLVGSSNQTITIVDAYDDPNIESDLVVYSSQYGLPQCTTANGCFRKINQRGGTSYPRKDAGWSLEISLDVQVAHAVCPDCHILLVEADSNSYANLMAAVDQAYAQGARIISNSYGSAEFSGETAYDFHFNHPDAAITVSAGDSGYGAEYPAASRFVTAVGGTTLTLSSDNTYVSEKAWSGSGSGCSSFEEKPAWQTQTVCGRRAIADVSADADPATGAAVYDSVMYQGRKGWFQVGGTSLAAPLIAGVYALGGVPTTGYGASLPWSSAPANLHDVTSGSNGSCGGSSLCAAVVGYDGPTGLGSPNSVLAF